MGQRLTNMQEWLTGKRAWAEDLRSSNRFVETGFRMLERDSRIAGGVLGGGLAYRLFFWSLALSVLAFGGLGFASSADVNNAAQNASLGASVANSLAAAAEQSQSGRWWLLITGIFLVIWFAFFLLRALRLVTASAWQVKSGSTIPRPINLLTFLSVPVIFILVSALTGWTANVLGIFSGIFAFILGTLIVAGLITLGFAWLPHRPVPLWAHIPGAVVIALVIQVLGAVGEFFIANQLADAEQLYGALGLAGTLLFVLFLVGRSMVWATELNAVWWEVWHEQDAEDVAAGPNGITAS